MTQVQFDDQQPEAPAQKPQGPGGRLMAAGVVGAIALGAGMGLWARPAPPPQAQPSAKPVAPEDIVRPALQIVVDDGPAPIGPLLEVLPGEASASEPPPLMAEPAAPRRPAAGLMKVDAVVAAEPLEVVPAVKVDEKPRALPPAPVKAAARQKAKIEKLVGETPKVGKAKTPNAEPKSDRMKIAEAKAKKAETAKAEKARAEKATRLAKVEKAKLEKAKAAKIAKTEVRKPKVDMAKAEPKRLASLVKAVKTAPAKLKAEAAKAKKVQLAKAKPKPRVEKASTKPAPVAKAKAPPPRKPSVPRGEGPMRVARNDGCASADPGEAVVCADGRLGARDRQLQQAYRNAEAAGVPASALRRQQARWLQARAAAAREAPWAVEDVYEARISELNDLTRDAREN